MYRINKKYLVYKYPALHKYRDFCVLIFYFATLPCAHFHSAMRSVAETETDL